MEKTTSKRNLSSYGKAIAFLAMEIIAIFAFNLGNSFIFYSILSIVLLAILIIFLFKQINKDGLASLGFFIFPILIYGLLIAISNFKQDDAFNLHGFTLVFIPICLSCVAAIGYFCAINKFFKIKQVLVVIYTAVAILTLINLVATLINFEPFHTLTYRGKFLYYDGHPSDVAISEMSYGLIGFRMTEISVHYASLYPSILLSSFIPLLYTKYSDDRKLFLLFLAYGCLGVISLILMPTIMTVISDIVVLMTLTILALSTKFHWEKIFKKVLIGGAVIVGLVFIVAVFNNFSTDNFIKSLISGNRLLNKAFNANRLANMYNNVLYGFFDSYKVFGSPTFATVEYPNGVSFTGSFLFDNLITGGIFGWILFLVILIIGIRNVVIYYRTSDDSYDVKITLLGFVLTFVAYTLVDFGSHPYIFEDTLMPLFENGLFLIVLMLFGYCFSKNEMMKASKTEIKESEVNKDEEFSI